MILVDVEQRSPEWLALRRGVISASAADRLLTPAKLRDYALELAAEALVREMPSQVVTDAMWWGINHEAEARLHYAFASGQHVTEVGFAWHDDWEGFAGCSPDGLVGEDGLVEIKCPTSKRHLEYVIHGGVPAHYVAQLQFQMWVTGRRWCDFVIYDPRFAHGSFFCVRVRPDEAMQQQLAAGVVQCVDLIRQHIDAVAAI